MSNRKTGHPIGGHGENDGLQALADIWQQTPVAVPVPEVIRARIRQQERRMRVFAVLEWAGSIAVGIGGVYLMMNSGMRDAPWRALLVLVLLTLAMAFSVSNRQGVWDPLEESIRGYLDLARLRLVRKRRMLRFAWLLFVAELGIFAVWQWLSQFGWLEPIFVGDGKSAISWILIFALGMATWSVWYWWRIKSCEQQIAEWQNDSFEVQKNKL
ncbi:hypothetical protein [Microbulbifer celer]|uniref:Transmembrane protein n=1 Tax=Microbulbifer celer TaxID=435905 RepID=A0ABW3U841_9GAMM|nr:hypothetical protein [Microbulbifer celer]UFN57303.1 hypothetical protein LPW13_17315 [Microbulbifer celer]